MNMQYVDSPFSVQLAELLERAEIVWCFDSVDRDAINMLLPATTLTDYMDLCA